MPSLFNVKSEAEWSWEKGVWNEIEDVAVAAEDAEEAIKKVKEHLLEKTSIQDEDYDTGKPLKKPITHKVLDVRIYEVEHIKDIDLV